MKSIWISKGWNVRAELLHFDELLRNWQFIAALKFDYSCDLIKFSFFVKLICLNIFILVSHSKFLSSSASSFSRRFYFSWDLFHFKFLTFKTSQLEIVPKQIALRDFDITETTQAWTTPREMWNIFFSFRVESKKPNDVIHHHVVHVLLFVYQNIWRWNVMDLGERAMETCACDPRAVPLIELWPVSGSRMEHFQQKNKRVDVWWYLVSDATI